MTLPPLTLPWGLRKSEAIAGPPSAARLIQAFDPLEARHNGTMEVETKWIYSFGAERNVGFPLTKWWKIRYEHYLGCIYNYVYDYVYMYIYIYIHMYNYVYMDHWCMEVFWVKWGYPYRASKRWEFPWNKSFSYWGSHISGSLHL